MTVEEGIATHHPLQFATMAEVTVEPIVDTIKQLMFSACRRGVVHAGLCCRSDSVGGTGADRRGQLILDPDTQEVGFLVVLAGIASGAEWTATYELNGVPKTDVFTDADNGVGRQVVFDVAGDLSGASGVMPWTMSFSRTDGSGFALMTSAVIQDEEIEPEDLPAPEG